MKHKVGFNRLGRREAHRKAMKNNMVTSLFRYERVQTTKAKALEVKRTAEKLVTRARVDSVHNRRVVAEKIHDKEILAKLFTEIAPRYLGRPGGYTRVLKTAFRQGDAAQMVILELVDRKIEEKPVRHREAASETTEAETPVEETAVEASEPQEQVPVADAAAEPVVEAEATESEESSTAEEGAQASAEADETPVAEEEAPSEDKEKKE